jgi:hypothetical protein
MPQHGWNPWVLVEHVVEKVGEIILTVDKTVKDVVGTFCAVPNKKPKSRSATNRSFRGFISKHSSKHSRRNTGKLVQQQIQANRAKAKNKELQQHVDSLTKSFSQQIRIKELEAELVQKEQLAKTIRIKDLETDICVRQHNLDLIFPSE